MSRGGSVAISSQNSRAWSRVAPVAKRRNSVISGAISPVSALSQAARTRSTMRRCKRASSASSARPSRIALIASLNAACIEAGSCAFSNKGRKPKPKRSCTSADTRESGIPLNSANASSNKAQDQAGGELTALAEMANERPQFGLRAAGGDRDRRLLASLAGDAPGAILLEPGAVDRQSRQAFCDSRVTRFCRVAAGRSSRAKSASRIAATSPNRSTIRSIDKGAISAPSFSADAY